MQFAQPISITAATFAVSKHHTGTTFYLNRAAGCTITLPAPSVNLKFKFIIGISPTTAYTINTNGGADIMVVEINELEVDTSDDGPYDTDADILTLVANTAVIGDWVDFECDGTKWYVRGNTNADGGITTGTT